METSNIELSLSNLLGGAVIERFDRELEKVHRDIADPNTSDKPREVTLKLKVIPNKNNRNIVNYAANVTPKLAASKPLETAVMFGASPDGKISARELTQRELFTGPQPVDIKKTGGENA